MVEVFAIGALNSSEFKQVSTLILSKLSASRRKSICRYRHESDQQRSLLAEAMLHFVINEKTGLFPIDYEILESEKGKPFIAQNFSNLHFNISHSGAWSVCAFGKSETGVDIEKMRHLDPLTANRILCTDEHNLYEKIKEEGKNRFLIQIWTLKESYLKAIGSGLTVPMNSFSVHFQKNILRIKIADKINPDYYLRVIPFEEDYQLAVCSGDPLFNKKVVFPEVDKILDFWKELDQQV